jgi:cytochrome P450
MEPSIMSRSATIAEWPVPPKRRLAFPWLILKMIGNPIGSWSEDFYREELILYRWLGLESAFIMDPALIQSVLLDDAGSYSKQPLNDDVFGEAIGGGLLNAEGEAWRWQRRLTAPLFRAEDVLAYIPAFAGACGTVLQRWREAPPGTSQAIDRDMTRATLQALQDSVLGASLGEADLRKHRAGRRRVPRSFGVEDRAHLPQIAAVDPPSRLARDDAGGPNDARHRHAGAGEDARGRGRA